MRTVYSMRLVLEAVELDDNGDIEQYLEEVHERELGLIGYDEGKEKIDNLYGLLNGDIKQNVIIEVLGGIANLDRIDGPFPEFVTVEVDDYDDDSYDDDDRVIVTQYD